ncbi:hypothetical protein SCAR479_04430 [Seiridium cardinale]|uniref:DUF7514 domain-containing protein n=1 Tax=Seiridium cardinale TaxID=138064 RepID=A0ABR2XYJ0_9PEZI
MAQERHPDPERASVPRLNILEWAAPSSHGIHTEERDDISPRSKSERHRRREPSSRKPDTAQPPTNDRDIDYVATTPVLLTKQVLDQHIANCAPLDEIRRIIREEGHTLLSEGLQKFTSVTGSHGFGSVSSASGSIVSSPSLDHSQSVPLTAASGIGSVSFVAQRPYVHFIDHRTFAKRPAGGVKATSNSYPPIEWGELFDKSGYATLRLGQVLRGLAHHITNEYVPKDSLVVTPEKIVAFYTKYQLEAEVIPFLDVFTSKARDLDNCLMEFYEDLKCEYHLVQKDNHGRPWILALTPTGFTQYLTICMLAYPDQEFRRFENIVADVPIIADGPVQGGTTDKLPRTIIRSCLPARFDSKSRKLLDSAFDDLVYDFRLSVRSSHDAPSVWTAPDRSGSTNTSHASVDYTPGLPQRPDQTEEQNRAAEEFDLKGTIKESNRDTLNLHRADTLVNNYEDSHRRNGLRHDEYHHEQGDRTFAGALKNSSSKTQSRNIHPSSSPTALHHHSIKPPRPSPVSSGDRSNSNSHFFSSSAPIPPPPIGPRLSIDSNISTPSSWQPLSPQFRGPSVSIPDVNLGISSPSSSAAIITPSTHSSTSLSPTAEHGSMASVPRHYDRPRRDSNNRPTMHPPDSSPSSSIHREYHPQRQHRLSSDLEIARAGHGSKNNGNSHESSESQWAIASTDSDQRIERHPAHRHQHKLPSVESVPDEGEDEHRRT